MSNLCTQTEKCSFIAKYILCFMIMRCTNHVPACLPNCPLSNTRVKLLPIVISEITPPLDLLSRYADMCLTRQSVQLNSPCQLDSALDRIQLRIRVDDMHHFPLTIVDQRRKRRGPLTWELPFAESFT